MKSRVVLIVLIVLAGMRVDGQEKGKVAGSGFLQQAFAAWNSHDPDKVVTFYTEDVVAVASQHYSCRARASAHTNP